MVNDALTHMLDAQDEIGYKRGRRDGFANGCSYVTTWTLVVGMLTFLLGLGVGQWIMT